MQHGQGSGKLVPTGKHEPELTVSYDIGLEVAKRQGESGPPTERSCATVHSIESSDGAEIPKGDYDMVSGGELLRLKHVSGSPEWLVLSSIP